MSSTHSYEGIKELTAINMGEDWFYVNSHLLNPETHEFKYPHQVEEKEILRLLDLVIDEICRKAIERPEIATKAVQELDAAIANTPEKNDAYYNLVTWEMGMTNLPFTTWEEFKNFLITLKKKLENALAST